LQGWPTAWSQKRAKIGAYLNPESAFDGPQKSSQKITPAQWQNQSYPIRPTGKHTITQESEPEQETHHNSRMIRSNTNNQQAA
jgi:hypothetical protein